MRYETFKSNLAHSFLTFTFGTFFYMPLHTAQLTDAVITFLHVIIIILIICTNNDDLILFRTRLQ